MNHVLPVPGADAITDICSLGKPPTNSVAGSSSVIERLRSLILVAMIVVSPDYGNELDDGLADELLVPAGYSDVLSLQYVEQV